MMSKRAGLVTGGIFSALGVVVCVACIGCKDRHAPHSALLSDGWANRSGSAPVSACIDARSESTFDRAAAGGVQIRVQVPQDAVPSGLIEDLYAARIETRM